MFLISCQSNNKRDILLQELKALETRISENNIPQPAQLDSLVQFYEQVVALAPKDTSAAKYLLKAAEAARTNFKFENALNIYDRIFREYASDDNAALALFMKGFILENDLNSPDSAKVIYLNFVQKYPNHELADDAQFLINNLGKSDEEIIREFEAKQNKQ
jgi:outer membrane protein assembly factor BamD (BamD/ComL family)